MLHSIIRFFDIDSIKQKCIVSWFTLTTHQRLYESTTLISDLSIAKNIFTREKITTPKSKVTHNFNSIEIGQLKINLFESACDILNESYVVLIKRKKNNIGVLGNLIRLFLLSSSLICTRI